jgi:hypothetical protein
MVASKGSTMILPLSLWGHINFNHSIIVTAEFNSIGLKSYLLSIPKSLSRCEYSDCSKFYCPVQFLLYLEKFSELFIMFSGTNSFVVGVLSIQFSFTFTCCKFLSFWFANFIASSIAIPPLLPPSMSSQFNLDLFFDASNFRIWFDVKFQLFHFPCHVLCFFLITILFVFSG